MSEEKPLHVRVAEALGCKPEWTGTYWRCVCGHKNEVLPKDVEKLPETPNHIAYWRERPDHGGLGRRGEVAHYDESWFATGPWIERLGLRLLKQDKRWYAGECEMQYLNGRVESGETPLLAVCAAILKIHAAGGLALDARPITDEELDILERDGKPEIGDGETQRRLVKRLAAELKRLRKENDE